MELDKESVILLIQKYQEHQILWDSKNKWYFHKIKKNAAWQDIADSIGIGVQDAKKKMSSLLGSFRREKSKGVKSIGTGKEASVAYKSDWFAFKSFSFLLDKDEPKKTINLKQPMENDTQIQIKYEQDDEKSSTNICSFETYEEVFVKPSTSRKEQNENREEDPRIEMAYKILPQPVEPEDATTTYAKYLAEKLNQFDARTKSILIHQFNNLIFEAEMELYSPSSLGYQIPSSSSN